MSHSFARCTCGQSFRGKNALGRLKDHISLLNPPWPLPRSSPEDKHAIAEYTLTQREWLRLKKEDKP